MQHRLMKFTALLLLLFMLLTGCGKSANTLPPLSSLVAIPENRVQEIVQNYSQEALRTGWGEPIRSLAGDCGDIWTLDDEREITVLYDEYKKVFVVRID